MTGCTVWETVWTTGEDGVDGQEADGEGRCLRGVLTRRTVTVARGAEYMRKNARRTVYALKDAGRLEPGEYMRQKREDPRRRGLGTRTDREALNRWMTAKEPGGEKRCEGSE